MTEPIRSAPIDALLEHAPWVRRLACALVGPDRAEDLTQDVWVAALRRPPAAEGSVRGWLKRVVVNRARQTRRGDARRGERERRVATPEAVDDPLERFGVHRDLVERIGELGEPWRRTILWRYFDDLSLKQIAAREGVPVSTVNTRLRRGKELLRERLDDAHGGDRRAWIVALVPLARDVQPLVPLTPAALTGIGAPLVAMKIPYVLSALAASAVAAFFILPERDHGPVVPAAPAPSMPEFESMLAPALRDDPDVRPVRASGRRAVERAAAAPVATPPVAAVEAAPATTALVGHVVDTHGDVMPGLEVWCIAGEEERLLGVSDELGRFPVDGERDLGRIEVRDERWGTALGCKLPRGARSGPTLIVAPWIEVGGVVRNEVGAPIARAQLVMAQPTSLRASVPDLHGSSVSHEPVTRTDLLGSFDFERALAVEDTRLFVKAQGYMSVDVPLPLVSTRAFEIVLRRPDATQDAVLGQVVDAGGRAVADAWVSLGYLCVQTDVSGSFRVALGREGKYDRVVAAKAGHHPAVLERPRNAATGEPDPWPDFLLLQLGDTPLRLAGRVIDSAGNPLSNWKVWLDDPTFFSSIDQRGVMAEGVSLDLLDARDEDERPTAAWPWTRTDADGRFELGGLFDRDYSLQVHHAASLLLVEAGPYRAGQGDVEIVLDLAELYGPVGGRVIDLNGDPIAGVTLDTWVATYRVPHGESGHLWWSEDGDPTTTDRSGHYRFDRLPRDGVTIRVKHPDILPEEFQLRRAPDGTPQEREAWDKIDFVIERRFHLQVEISAALAESGTITLLDGANEATLIQVFSAGGHMTTRRYRFEAGKTEVLSVLGSVREVVLFDSNENEITRRKVGLIFGELNIVRF